jgi:exonuclease III
MSARATLPISGIVGALLALQLLPTAALADDRRPDPASLSVMTINTYFMWDGVAPEDGSSQIDIPWRNSQLEAEEHMAAIAEVIARANPDIVNLVEIENEAALTTLNDRFLPGRGYRPYFVQGGDTFTGQDVGLLTRIDPDGDQIHFDDREGQSGNVSKSVSKNYNAVITVGDTKILVVGLHFLAQPNRPDRRLQREAQADAIRSIVQEKRCAGCEVIVLGDFNDYDGASDALDHVNSAPITNVMLAIKRLDLADPADDLVNAAVFVPKGERFTAFFDQDEDLQVDRPHELTSIDHVLLSQGLADQLDAVEIDHDLNPALGTDGFVSDHFPIVVRFDLEGPIQQPTVSVRLALLLPNPPGDESQNEEATLANDGTHAVTLTGWTLRDRAGRSWVLDSLGTMAPGEEKAIQRGGQPMAMNNTGDTIDLLDADGQVVDSVTYGVVAEGEFVISN